jgi:hypothetical protein
MQYLGISTKLDLLLFPFIGSIRHANFPLEYGRFEWKAHLIEMMCKTVVLEAQNGICRKNHTL